MLKEETNTSYGSGRPKLSSEQVREIRSDWPQYSKASLAKRYNVSRTAIRKILNHHVHKES